MSMNSFEVVTDNSHRIRHFVPDGHDGTEILPEQMADYLDGGERVEYHGQEYDITEKGGLTHPTVEVPVNVLLGHGVLIGEGVELEAYNGKTGGIRMAAAAMIQVGSRSRLERSKTHCGVILGNYAVVLHSTLGHFSTFGDYNRIISSAIGNGVATGNNVRIDRESTVGSGAKLGDNVRLGYKTRTTGSVILGRNVHVGKFNGAPLSEAEKDGFLILGPSVIAPKSVIHSDVLRRNVGDIEEAHR